MVRITYNENKDTYNLKGMSYEHLTVLAGLLSHTCLGLGGMPKSAYELCEVISKEVIEPCSLSVSVDGDGYFSLTVE